MFEREPSRSGPAEDTAALLLDNAPTALIMYGSDGRVVRASPSLHDIFGFDASVIVGSDFRMGLPAERDATELSVRVAIAEMREQVTVRITAVTADGRERQVDVTSRFVYKPDNTVDFVVAEFYDVTDLLQADVELAANERLFRQAIESSVSGMAIVDMDGRLTHVNRAIGRMLDRSAESFLDQDMDLIVTPEDRELCSALRFQALSSPSGTAKGDVRLVRADGSVVWVELGVGIIGDDDQPDAFVCQFVNITETRRSGEQLRFLASHDSLTQLVNRRELINQMATALEYKPRTGTSVGVLFLDLDDFKPVNDIYGHHAGDQLLVDVANRISAQVRGDDIVARQGGDEFVVVLPAVKTIDDAIGVANKIHRAMETPFDIKGSERNVGLSIGVALAMAGDDTDEVLRRADMALYRAKRSGGRRTVGYDQRVDEPERFMTGA